jgi:hypothetical protein
VQKVYSVELIEELATQAKQRFERMGYDNIEQKIGNGYYGWPEHAPFDRIIVTAAPDLIPPELINQLKPGGKMVIPSGIPGAQQLMLVTKATDGKLTIKEVLPVRFFRARRRSARAAPTVRDGDRTSAPAAQVEPVHPLRQERAMQTTWILAADSSRARIFEVAEKGAAPDRNPGFRESLKPA